MSQKLAVVCPQCKIRLQVGAEEQSKLVTCPDCEMQFKIGSVRETVVAEKMVDTTASGSGVPFNSGRLINDTDHEIRSAKEGSNRPSRRRRRYVAAKRRRRAKSEMDEIMQSTGIFLIIMAVFAAFLPFFDLGGEKFAQFNGKVIWLSLSVALVGSIMLIVSNRQNPLIALGTGIGIALLGLVAWFANSDLFDLNNPLRPQDESEMVADGNLDQAPNQTEGNDRDNNRAKVPPKVVIGNEQDRLIVAPGFGNPGQALQGDTLGVDAGVMGEAPVPQRDLTQSPFAQAKSKPKSNQVVDSKLLERIQNDNTVVGSEAPQRSENNPSTRRAEEVIKNKLSENSQISRLESIQEKRAEINKRVRRFTKAGFIEGKADSPELVNNYYLTKVLGIETTFGDALYDSLPLKGLDAVAHKKGGFEHFVPIVREPRHSDSLAKTSADYLCGLNLNIEDQRILGIQAVFSQKETSGQLNMETTETSNWRGVTPKLGNTSAITGGGRIIVGLVVYKNSLEQIQGIRLICKK